MTTRQPTPAITENNGGHTAIPAKMATCVDPQGHQHPVPADQLVWRPAAYGVIIKDGKLLVAPHRVGFDLPGGGLELGETPETAAIREVKEETGLDVANPRLLGVETSFFRFADPGGFFAECLMFYYACELVGGEISDAGFDEWEREYTQLAEWYSLDKLDAMIVDSSIDFRAYVRRAMAGQEAV